MFWNDLISFGQANFLLFWQGKFRVTGIYSDKPNLSFWVSELHSDKANLLFRVTRIIPDMPLVFDWKQVDLSDFVFCQKLTLLGIAVSHRLTSTALTTTPFEL